MRPLSGIKLRRNTMHDEGNNDWGGDKKTLECVLKIKIVVTYYINSTYLKEKLLTKFMQTLINCLL